MTSQPAKKGRKRQQVLTARKVHAIRRGYRPGDSVIKLAEQYGVNRASIVEVLNQRTWSGLTVLPGEYSPPDDVRGTRRLEKKSTQPPETGRVEDAPAKPTTPRPAAPAPRPAPVPAPTPAPRAAPRPTAAPAPAPPTRKGTTKTPAPQEKKKRAAKGNKNIPESTVRAIRRSYRPGVRLSRLTERFDLTGAVIVSIANRCSYTDYPTGENEYEPPADIRGTRRRETPRTPTLQERKPMPILRTDTKHLMPQAIMAIREAVDDGEPIRRVARCFGLAPEAIAHMKRPDGR